MMNCNKFLFAILLCIGSISFVFAQDDTSATGKTNARHSLQTVYESEPEFQFCEGFAMDPSGKFLYVSNVIGGALDKDGKAAIYTIDLDGKILNREWLTEGMNAPKDICIHGRNLYIADCNEILVADLDQARIVKRYAVEGANLLHNVTVNAQGVIFASDMFSGKIYQIKEDTVSVYKEGLNYAAGLLSEGDDLYVLTSEGFGFPQRGTSPAQGAPSGQGNPPAGMPPAQAAPSGDQRNAAMPNMNGGKLIKIDKDRNVTVITTGFNSLGNGLQRVGKDEFVISCWSGIAYYVNADGTHEVIRNTLQNPHIPCGLMYYDEARNLLYMSTDENNKIMIFSIQNN